jgi:DHA2 family multidrug resistance protein
MDDRLLHFQTAAASFLDQARRAFLQQTGDPVAAQQLAWRALENLRWQQAPAPACFDAFWMMAVLTFIVAFLLLFVERSVAEKGSHAGQE